MNSIFEINKVYSNSALCHVVADRMKSSLLFWVELYNGKEDECPYPLARKEYEKHINKWYDKMHNFIVPVKRTRCFLTYDTIYGYTDMKKIRKDENGNEYILVEGVKVSASDLSEDSVYTWNAMLDAQKCERCYEIRYIGKLAHLEEYGYVYRDNLTKVESIDELNKAYNWLG